MADKKCELGVFFIAPSSGALGEPPESTRLFEERRKKIMEILRSLYPVSYTHLTLPTTERV